MILCFSKESENVVKLFTIVEQNGGYIPAFQSMVNSWSGEEQLQWVKMPSDIFDSESKASLGLINFLDKEGYTFVGRIENPNTYLDILREELGVSQEGSKEVEEVIPEEI